MAPITPEDAVLDRFRQKCRAAGEPRTGFVLRRAAILYVRDRYPDLDLEKGIAGLLDQEVLRASESGDFLFLTETGAERLSAP